MWMWRVSGTQHHNPGELWAPEEETEAVRRGHSQNMFHNGAKWIFLLSFTPSPHFIQSDVKEKGKRLGQPQGFWLEQV